MVLLDLIQPQDFCRGEVASPKKAGQPTMELPSCKAGLELTFFNHQSKGYYD